MQWRSNHGTALGLLLAATMIETAASETSELPPCRLALVFALDVSASVNADEYALQRDGLAAALLAPEIVPHLLPNPAGRVALAAFEWSGRYQSAIRLDWLFIDTPDDIGNAARIVGASNRSQTTYPTALGYALGFAATMLAQMPDSTARKIDVSGDGRNNDGFVPELAYRAFPFASVTVNGLAIRGDDAGINAYYRAEVIRGPGAFVITADGYQDFRRAMHLKLLRELGDQLIGSLGRPQMPGIR